LGQCEASGDEVDRGLKLICAAWASGEYGMGWQMWPDNNDQKLSEVIKSCWREVEKHQESLGERPTRLEPIVARKVQYKSTLHMLCTNS